MMWLVIVVAVVLLVAGGLALAYRNGQSAEARYRARVELHGIRRRQEVTQLKGEIRRDAADARRELRAELRELEEADRS